MFPITPATATAFQAAADSQNDKIRAAEQYRMARRARSSDIRETRHHWFGFHRQEKTATATGTARASTT